MLKINYVIIFNSLLIYKSTYYYVTYKTKSFTSQKKLKLNNFNKSFNYKIKRKRYCQQLVLHKNIHIFSNFRF